MPKTIILPNGMLEDDNEVILDSVRCVTRNKIMRERYEPGRQNMGAVKCQKKLMEDHNLAMRTVQYIVYGDYREKDRNRKSQG